MIRKRKQHSTFKLIRDHLKLADGKVWDEAYPIYKDVATIINSAFFSNLITINTKKQLDKILFTYVMKRYRRVV